MSRLYKPKRTRIKIPIKGTVKPVYDLDVIYLYKWDCTGDCPMSYLASRKNLTVAARKHGLKARFAMELAKYRVWRPCFVQDLAEAIPDAIDAMVSVPSESDEMKIYCDEIRKKHRDIVDLTSRVLRDRNVTSTSGHTDEERLKAMSYRSVPSDSNLRQILILDDVLNTGLSIAGLVRALCVRLEPPLEFTVACPLWINKP